MEVVMDRKLGMNLQSDMALMEANELLGLIQKGVKEQGNNNHSQHNTDGTKPRMLHSVLGTSLLEK